MRQSVRQAITETGDAGFGRAEAQQGVFRIAAIQMVSGPQVAANLAEAARLIEIAAIQGAQLVALPEHFAMMGMKDTDKLEVAECFGSGPIQDFLSRTARKHSIWLIGGSIPTTTSVPEKACNTCIVYDDQGKVAGRYDKIHLFGLELGTERFNEGKTIEPGNKVVVISSPFGRLGLSICYDLRFPELYRAMKRVDIISVPSAFTETTGRAHWEILVRARAVENLAYVLAPAQGGYHVSGRETHGQSMIVDPWGIVLDRLPRGPGVVIAGINPSYQAGLRKSLPAVDHRKLDQI
jgi:deaminated glutathione amidase